MKEKSVLRMYTGEKDRFGNKSLSTFIIEEAHRHGLPGATAFRGTEGYGENSRIHSMRILSISDELPIIVEVVADEVVLKDFYSYIKEKTGRPIFAILTACKIL